MFRNGSGLCARVNGPFDVVGMSSEKIRRYEVWNELSDADPLWGPFAFLRPAQNREFSRLRLLAVTTLFGGFYGMCANVVLVWIHHLTHFRVFPVAALPVALVVTSFLCGELTFRPAWNMRARRTTRRSTWLANNGRPAATHGDDPSSSSEA
jgi:hypothetical protein